MQKSKTKGRFVFFRFSYSVHKWLGLVTGFFLFIYGISGSVLVFKDDLDSHFYQPKIEVKSSKIGIDSVYSIITKQHQALDGIAWLNPEGAENEPYLFRLYLNDARLASYDLGLIAVNQYTGQILRNGRGDDLQVGWIEWIFQLHFSLHLGMPGAAFTTIVGITLLLSVATGLLIFRKKIWKVLTFKERFKTRKGLMWMSGLHRYVGVWSLVLNIIIFFSGFWMNLFSLDFCNWKKETIATEPNHHFKGSLNNIVQNARIFKSDWEMTYVYLPTQKEKKVRFRGMPKSQNALFGSANSIIYDPDTEKLLSETNWDGKSVFEKFDALMFPLHAGNFGGMIIKILYVIIGFTPAFLSLTGFYLWFRKRK